MRSKGTTRGIKSWQEVRAEESATDDQWKIVVGSEGGFVVKIIGIDLWVKMRSRYQSMRKRMYMYLIKVEKLFGYMHETRVCSFLGGNITTLTQVY